MGVPPIPSPKLPRKIAPEDVVRLAREAGVPPRAVPVVAIFTLENGSSAGWFATPRQKFRHAFPVEPDSPPGELTIVGALTPRLPDDDPRPCLNLHDEGLIAIYRARFVIPSGLAAADVRWPAAPATPRGEVMPHLRAGAVDLAEARRALRWLHGTAPRPARPRLPARTAAAAGSNARGATPDAARRPARAGPAEAEDAALRVAAHAEELKRRHPRWTWLHVAYCLGLVQAIAEEGHSRDPERAALRRLRRLRKKLHELG